MSPAGTVVARGFRFTSRWVLLVQAIFVAVLYRGTVRCELLSDDWEMIDQASHGFWRAVSSPIGYHYIPVCSAFYCFLWSTLGLRAWPYHAIVLAVHAAVGYLVFQLGIWLFDDRLVAAGASVLFLASASFHEVTFWTAGGTAFVLAALFFYLGLRQALLIAQKGASWARGGVLAFWFFVGVFTHPAVASLLPCAAATLVWGWSRGGDGGPARFWRSSETWMAFARSLGPSGLVCVPLVLARAHFAAALASEERFGFDFEHGYWAVRGVISTFSLRGSHDVLHRWLCLGGAPADPRPFVVAWLLLGLGAALWILVRRARSPVALLVSWLVIYFGLAGASVGVSSRHTYIPAVPATLLTAWGLRQLGLVLSRHVARGRWVRAVPLLLGFSVLLWGASIDRRDSGRVWGRAYASVHRTLADIRSALEAGARPARLVLVNLPRFFALNGIGAFVFANGVPSMVRLTFAESVDALEIRSVAGLGPPVSGSTDISVEDLVSPEGPPRLVLLFDPKTGGVGPATAVIPDHYTPDTASFLPWQAGAWPWLLLPAGTRLELPMKVAPSESWASTRYAERPGTRFYVGAQGQVPLLVAAPRGAADRWVLGTWPLGTHDSRSIATLVISADSEVWLGALWAFEPPRRYDAVTAPYLPWGPDGAGGTSLPIVGEVILPLTAAVGQPRSVRLEYLAERGRRLSVTIGGRTEELAAAVSPTWRTVELPVEGSPPVLRLTQTRKLYPLVRWIELGPASQPRPPT